MYLLKIVKVFCSFMRFILTHLVLAIALQGWLSPIMSSTQEQPLSAVGIALTPQWLVEYSASAHSCCVPSQCWGQSI